MAEELPPQNESESQERPPPEATRARLPSDATDEEIVVWLTLVAERLYLYNGTPAEEIATKLVGQDDVSPIVDVRGPEFAIGSPVVLWADFGYPHTPEPDLNDLFTVASWVWG